MRFYAGGTNFINKRACFMLNFLNLKSFPSYLFFCSSIQPQHTVLSSLLELQKCLNDLLLSEEKYKDEYSEFSFQMQKEYHESHYKRVLQNLRKLKLFQDELRKENDMMKNIAYKIFQVQSLT